ncbi:MAG: universal stress protein [Nocardioides sp.]
MTEPQQGRTPVVVVGVDCSDRSVPVLQWTARYARAQGARVRVVAAWHFPEVAGHRPVRVEADMSARLETLVAGLVSRTMAGLACETVVHEANPAQLLLHEAAGADLLVLGSRGHDHAYRPGLGSVTFACLNAAPCPVVVVPVDGSP